MKSTAVMKAYRCTLSALGRVGKDSRGVAAIEFAFVLPVMVILYVMTVELSNAFAVHRKVTIAARSISDLISQYTAISDSELANSFTAGSMILTPYSSMPMKLIISEVKIDVNGKATIAWTKNTGYDSGDPPPHNVHDIVQVPAALAVPSTYLIWSQIGYTYTPIIGYISNATLPLGSQFFTRPRQSACVLYSTTSCP
jgi:Flp pilus assembly protein TadG